MGKAADNERVKLRATFLNNSGAGLVVGGTLVPLLAALTKDVVGLSAWWIVGAVGTVAIVWMVGFMMQNSADTTLKGIQD
jgi:hypothetical protein